MGASVLKNLLTLSDLDPDDFAKVLSLGREAYRSPHALDGTLRGRIVASYFPVPSTRTRTSFQVAAHRLGASVVAYGGGDLQLATGESLADTLRVLGEMVDAFVIRTNGPLADLREAAGSIPIVNAMSACEHPSQAIADFIAMEEVHGRGHDFHIAYFGEGNNTAVALARAAALAGCVRLSLLTPPGYGIPAHALHEAQNLCRATQSIVEQWHDPERSLDDVDFVYTTRWETMGVEHPDKDFRRHFAPFQVDLRRMQALQDRSHGKVYFMHDLPAVRGAEVTAEVLDGSLSIALRQSRHKVSAAMAILAALVTTAGRPRDRLV